jgi:translocation and assembly module TamB
VLAVFGLLLVLGAGLVYLASAGFPAESARATVVLALSQALGREVNVSRLAGDPLRGIELTGVRIAAWPGERGNFLDVSRMVLRFRLLPLLADLLRGRGPTPSLATIELHRPKLFFSRDKKGHWNFPEFPHSRQRGPGLAAFTGTIELREGTVVFSDAWELPKPFLAHFERVTGSVSWQQTPLLRLDMEAVNTDGRTPALLHVAGTALPAADVADLTLGLRGMSTSYWGPYLAPMDRLQWVGGTVDGDLHVLLSRWGTETAVDYRARLQIHDGRAVILPQRVALAGIEGPLVLENTRLATDGMTVVVERSPVWVRGEIRPLVGPYVDLAVRSASLDLTTFRRLFFPAAGLQISGRAGGEIRVSGEAGSLLVEGVVDDAAGRIGRQEFSGLTSQVQYYGGVLVFNDATVAMGGGQAHGYARISVPTREFFVLANLDRVGASAADDGGLTAIPLQGATSGFVAVAGSPRAMVGQARLTLTNGTIAGLTVDRADLVVGFDRDAVTVDRFEAHSGPALVHAAGRAVPGGPLDLALVAADVNLRSIGALLGPPPWLAGTVDLTGRVVGTSNAPILSGRVDARDGRLGPFPFDQAVGRVQISEHGLQTPGVVLRDGAGLYEATGEVRWTAPERLNVAIRAQRMSAQRLLDIAKVPLDVAGAVEGNVRVTGTLRDPLADGSVVLTGGLVQGQRVDRVSAAFRWTGTALYLDDALLEVNASRIAMRGSVDQQGRLALDVAAKDFNLRGVAALRNDAIRVEGAVDLKGTLGGTLGAPEVAASVSSTNLRLNGQPVDRAEGTVRYERSRIVLAPLTLSHAGGALQLSGTVLFAEDPVLDLRVDAHQARLTTLLGLGRLRAPFALDGAVEGRIILTGRLSNPGATLAAELTDGVVGEHPIQHAAVSATLTNRAVQLRTLSIAPEQGTLIGVGRFDLSGTSELELSGEGLDLDLLRPLLGFRQPLGGALEFTLQFSGPPTDPLVGLSAMVTDGRIGSTVFDRVVFQAYYQGGQLHIEQGLLQQERHRVEIAGTLPVDLPSLRFDEAQPVDLHLSLVNADLSLLVALTARVERAQGPLAGEVRLTGTPAQPHLEGTLAVSNGTLKLRELEPALTDLQAQVSLADAEVRIASLRAQAGDGTLALAGTVSLQQFRPDRVALVLEAAGARLQYAPRVDGVFDGVVRVDGPLTRPTVTGSIVLSHGDLFIPSGQVPAEVVSDTGPVLDLALASGEGVWVNLGRLRLQVHGTVRASGTWQRPRLAGEVESVRGNFTAFNSTFNLTEGRATFAEFRGTTPYVDARAETTMQVVTLVGAERRVDPYRVFLHIYGTPDALVVDLTSDPFLARERILAGLAGRVGVTRLLRGAEVESALQAEVGTAVFGTVGRAVAEAFGLEEFTIVYDAERPLVLRVGASVVPNVYMTMTSELGVSPRHVWSLEYRFTPIMLMSFSVSNQGTYDVFYRIVYRF